MRIDLPDGFYLSPVRDGDQPAYLEHFRDQETTDCLLLVPFPYTQKDADEWVQAREKSAEEYPFETQFAIRRGDGFLIGGIGFLTGKGASAHRGEVGYWVARDYRRLGIATNALKAIVDYAFNDVALQRLQALVFEYNVPSQAVLEKAGFEREGLLKGYHVKHGTLRNAVMYGLVRADEANGRA
jgi:RimJ/RimL family protein N-acetyltransferase